MLLLSANFTRPADTTAYGSGDLLANSTTAGSVVPLTFNTGNKGGQIVEARLKKSDTTVTNATFNLLMFASSPTPANGDNGAISTNYANYLGTIIFPIMVAATDAGYTQLLHGQTNFIQGLWLPPGPVYGLLSPQAAYAPASAEVFTAYLTIRD